MNTYLRTPKPDNATVGRTGPQSVGRVFSILESLAGARSGATLTELALKARAPKTSLVGLLAGLAAEGCVERDGDGRYRLGPRFLSLAMQAVSGRDTIELARPFLAGLVEATARWAFEFSSAPSAIMRLMELGIPPYLINATVLGVLAPDADLAIYLDRIESANPIRYAVTIGERRELHCTAIGKMLLAHFDDDHLARYFKAAPPKRFTASTVTSRAGLLAEISAIRRDGIARTSDERVIGASGIAAPVYGPDGSLVAALLIAGPSERMRTNARRNEAVLLRAAAECTALHGGRPPATREPKEKSGRTRK